MNCPRDSEPNRTYSWKVEMCEKFKSAFTGHDFQRWLEGGLSVTVTGADAAAVSDGEREGV